jgi:hypothetical protein
MVESDDDSSSYSSCVIPVPVYIHTLGTVRGTYEVPGTNWRGGEGERVRGRDVNELARARGDGLPIWIYRCNLLLVLTPMIDNHSNLFEICHNLINANC